MKSRTFRILLLPFICLWAIGLPAAPAAGGAADEPDPYLWLEDLTGDRALAWVRERSATTTNALTADPRFKPLQRRFEAILDSNDRIPNIAKHGRWFYNFWRDQQHPRGRWRRVSSLAEYAKLRPAWETVLDLDLLAASEKENWVWHDETWLYPNDGLCLIHLSRGGADADVVREFDARTKKFVENGFTLPEAKSSVAWKDRDTLFVGTDFGPGSMTDSGYPRIVKEWRRGTPLSAAGTIYEGKSTDVAAGAARSWDHGRVRDFVSRNISTFENELWLIDGGKLVKIDVPLSANVETWDDQILVTLRDDWTVGGRTWPKGSLLAADFDGFLKGGRAFEPLFTPTPCKALAGIVGLKSGLIVNELEDVHNGLFVLTREDGRWTRKDLPSDGLLTVSASPFEPDDSDEYWLESEGFTSPETLAHASLGNPPVRLKQNPAFFKGDDLVVEQHFATSKDGAKVPYFQVSKKDLRLDGSHPTMLTGYGGFEISLTPNYAVFAGPAWLEKGGVYVQANIRGGGEYGPAWHQAAVKAGRQHAYDDFAAIAEDLIARRVTTSAKLGIEGGSNGGLLVGVMLTHRPELFGAVVCESPLLDMRRYTQLLAGASWMGEYGDPTVPGEWAFIGKYSPYQNVRREGRYPRTLIMTSTRDDRVHPGHARKMAARMQEWGKDVLFYENVEGGHAGAANHGEIAFSTAMTFVFLYRQLGL
jgi:prolyl oligopeptidase